MHAHTRARTFERLYSHARGRLGMRFGKVELVQDAYKHKFAERCIFTAGIYSRNRTLELSWYIFTRVNQRSSLAGALVYSSPAPSLCRLHTRAQYIQV